MPLSTRTSTIDKIMYQLMYVLLQSRYSMMYILFCFARSRYDKDKCVNIVNRISFYRHRSWGCLVFSSLSQKTHYIVIEITITMGHGYWMGFIKQTWIKRGFIFICTRGQHSIGAVESGSRSLCYV